MQLDEMNRNVVCELSKRAELTDAILRLDRSLKRTSSIWEGGRSGGRSQGRTLKVLAENDGLKASELANLLNLSPSTLSEKLQKLEDDGNIERVRDRNDLRVVRIFITDKGREIVKKRSDGTKKAKVDFSDVLSAEEFLQFQEMCARLTKSLDDIYADEKRKRVEFLSFMRDFNELDEPAFEYDSDKKTG